MARAQLNVNIEEVEVVANPLTETLTDDLMHLQMSDESTSTNDVIVVEERECPICLQICVHPSKLPCGHIFCFLCVKGLKNHRCAMCRTEFPTEFFERPELLHPIEATASTSSNTINEYQWFYKGRNGWWQYDERTCQEIENSYKNGEKQCTILVAGYVYVVDFDQMLQQRQSDPSRKRQVKRDLASIPKKGVAGLRLQNGGLSSLGDDIDMNQQSGNIIASIAVAEAAIRIASDIIDSTLAHADEYQTATDPSEIANDLVNAHVSTNENNESSGQSHQDELNRSGSSPSASTSALSRRELLDEIEETMNISNPSSINNSFGTSSTHLDDFFKITLNDFRHLASSNIVDDSSDDNIGYDDQDDDDDDDDDGENDHRYNDQRMSNDHFYHQSTSRR